MGSYDSPKALYNYLSSSLQQSQTNTESSRLRVPSTSPREQRCNPRGKMPRDLAAGVDQVREAPVLAQEPGKNRAHEHDELVGLTRTRDSDNPKFDKENNGTEMIPKTSSSSSSSSSSLPSSLPSSSPSSSSLRKLDPSNGNTEGTGFQKVLPNSEDSKSGDVVEVSGKDLPEDTHHGPSQSKDSPVILQPDCSHPTHISPEGGAAENMENEVRSDETVEDKTAQAPSSNDDSDGGQPVEVRSEKLTEATEEKPTLGETGVIADDRSNQDVKNSSAEPAEATAPPVAKKRYNAELIIGDLLDIPNQYKDCLICHQCNTMTTGARGIAQLIFRKYPHSNVYARRKNKFKEQGWNQLGTIEVCPPVCNLYSQHRPGQGNSTSETKEMRYKWLEDCLKRVKIETTQKVIAFPYLIGCGLAGGDWKRVQKIIDDFANEVHHEQGRIVLIVKLQEKPPKRLLMNKASGKRPPDQPPLSFAKSNAKPKIQ